MVALLIDVAASRSGHCRYRESRAPLGAGGSQSGPFLATGAKMRRKGFALRARETFIPSRRKTALIKRAVI
jgi:hypothetical protein